MLLDMDGKYCMVTGASSGIGREISLALAKSGGHVIMVCRDASRGKTSFEYVRRESGNNSGELFLADLSSQQQIRELVHAYRAKHNKLHVLVNNAGVIMSRRALTEDGIEMTFAVNYLAYYMLTILLMDLLKDSAPSRIINISSGIHRAISMDFSNLQGEKKYNRDTIYAQSKLADIIFTNELARRLQGTGVTANCVCPGAVSSNIWAHSSKVVNTFFRILMKGPKEGAKIPVYLASSAEVAGLSGKYFQTRQHLKLSRVETQRSMCESSAETYNRDTAQRLWTISGALTGITGETW